MHRLHRLLPLTMLVPIVLVASSCSTGDRIPATPRSTPTTVHSVEPTTGSTETTPSTQPPTLTPDATVSRTSVCPEPALVDPFTGPAADHFGATAVLDAYCETAGFLHGRAITTLTDPAQADLSTAHADLSFVSEHLTVRADQDWNKATTAGDTDTINTLTYYRLPVGRLGYAFALPGPTSLDGDVSSARADTVVRDDGSTALALWFTVTNHVSLVKTDAPTAEPTHQMPLVRDVALYLSPNPDKTDHDHDWLIASWTTEWRTEPVRPMSLSR